MSDFDTLPTALVIGPMKAGTTWIHDYLDWRGDVCLPAGVKETWFFDRYYERGKPWYARHYRRYAPATHSCIVEVAPSIFHDPSAPSRVRETLGSVPLVIAARDPVARSWSHYQHLRRRGYTTATLREAVKSFPEILEASRYDAQIARWRDALPDSPITILKLDTLAAARDAYTAHLCGALDLDFRPAPESLTESNAAGAPPSFLLAKYGRIAARTIRSAGGYAVVNLAKRAGLKRVFFGGATPAQKRLKPQPEDLAWLKHALASETSRAGECVPPSPARLSGRRSG